jgi:hypothetical protein
MSGSANAGQNVILCMALVCAVACVSRPAFSTTYYVSCANMPVTVMLLNQSWNAIGYSAAVNTDNSGMASFSTNATSSTGKYFMLLPYLDTSLTSYYCDSYQNRAWTTYFTVQ